MQPAECFIECATPERKLGRCIAGPRHPVDEADGIEFQPPTGRIRLTAEPGSLGIPGQRAVAVVGTCLDACVAESGQKLRRPVQLKPRVLETIEWTAADHAALPAEPTPPYRTPDSRAMSGFQVVRSFSEKSDRLECPHARASIFINSTVASR